MLAGATHGPISRYFQGITPIWYIYAMASVQLLQVVNTSVNFPIYWFVGNFRETFLNLFCGSEGVMGRVRATLFNSDSDHCQDETNIEMMSRQSSVPAIWSNNTGADNTGYMYEKLLKPVKM